MVFSIIDSSQGFEEKFDIFQIHDGRDGCAPPLKVNIQPNGVLRLYADYKTGPGEQCVKDVIKSTGIDRVVFIPNDEKYTKEYSERKTKDMLNKLKQQDNNIIKYKILQISIKNIMLVSSYFKRSLS